MLIVMMMVACGLTGISEVRSISPTMLRSRAQWMTAFSEREKNGGEKRTPSFPISDVESKRDISVMSEDTDTQRFRSTREATALEVETEENEALSFHRCKFVGVPRVLKRPGQPDWNGHGWRFGHDFKEEECHGGLPSGDCFAGFHGMYHCGRDEQWKIRGDNAGVEWTNWHPCRGGLANVTVDFVCVKDAVRAGTIHRCSFQGTPEPMDKGPAGAPLEDPSRKDTAAAGSGGWFRHRLAGGDCSNGWPSDVSKCVASLRNMNHCGGDHDWTLNVEEDGSAEVTWYTSYGCAGPASVGVDLFCPAAVNPVHCEFIGTGYEEHPSCPVTPTERHANEPLPGLCLRHEFARSECVLVDGDGETSQPPENWYVDKMCLGVFRGGQHCGQEEDWRVQGGLERSASGDGVLSTTPTVVWWNAQPCGEATVRVDYHCLSVLPKKLTASKPLSEKLVPDKSPLLSNLEGLGGLARGGGNETVFGSRRSEGWRKGAQDLGRASESV